MIIDVNEMMEKPWYRTYPEGLRQQLKTYTLPEIPVFRLLESTAKYYPESTAVVYEPENFMVSSRDLLHLCERFGSGLQQRFGVKKGDRVAFYSRNYPELIVAFFGLAMAGGIYVACNPLLIKEELRYQLEDSKATIIIISDDMIPVLEEIVEEKGTGLESIIVFNRDKELKQPLLGGASKTYAPPFFSYSDVFSDSPLEKPDIDPPKDLIAIMYTSGTTSYPKGVLVTHGNVVSSSIIYGTVYTGKFPDQDAEGYLQFTNDEKDLSMEWDFPFRHGIDSVLSVPPWTHMMGFLGQMIYPIMSAMTIFPMPVFNIDDMLRMIKKWKIAFAGGAPQMIATLLARPDIDQQDISCIRAWTAGGAPVPVALGEAFEKRIGGVISEAWTLTEAVMTSTKNYANKSGFRKWGSVGVPLPFTDLRIVDAEKGNREVPVNEEGELIQRGPSVALGYLNRPEDTQETFRDGWLFTGDLGTMDENGFFYITGRKKELIKYKGYNIAPRMLEEILYKHPAVTMCAAVGKKDPAVGEIPIAFIQLKEGADITPDQLMTFVNGQVAPYKKLREVRIVEKIPLLATGKLNRRELNKLV